MLELAGKQRIKESSTPVKWDLKVSAGCWVETARFPFREPAPQKKKIIAMRPKEKACETFHTVEPPSYQGPCIYATPCKIYKIYKAKIFLGKHLRNC